MIQHVERFQAKLQRVVFRVEHAELLMRRKIEREDTGTDDSISSNITESASRLQNEGVRVIPARRLGIIEIFTDTGGIRPVEEAPGPRSIDAADCDGLRKAALNGPD